MCVCSPLPADCQPASAVCGGVEPAAAAGREAQVEQVEQQEQRHGSSPRYRHSFPEGGDTFCSERPRIETLRPSLLERRSVGDIYISFLRLIRITIRI